MGHSDRNREDVFPASINYDQKQRINLSARAMDVIQLDAAAFGNGMNRTGFLNELLRRVTAGSDATVDSAVMYYMTNYYPAPETNGQKEYNNSSIREWLYGSQQKRPYILMIRFFNISHNSSGDSFLPFFTRV